jgi:hypothetical protein
MSMVVKVDVNGGDFMIVTTCGGAGIGSGLGNDGRSSVDVLQIRDGHSSISSTGAAGIGTDIADIAGMSVVSDIEILGGYFTVWPSGGSGIGSGTWIEATPGVWERASNR